MNRKPLVTVLMGSYNPRWDRLRRAVESLRRQTLEDWELVLWDDGSCPRGAMALEQAAGLDNRVRLYRGRENRGLGYALNRCAQRAQGRYLARLDDDDVCHPRRLERQVSFLESHPQYGWVGSAAWRVDSHGLWGRLDVPEMPAPRDFASHSPYIHPAVLFRREALAQGYSQSPPVPGLRGLPAVPAAAPAGLAGVQLALAPAGLLGGQGLLPPPGHGPPPAGGRSPPGGAGCLGPAVALNRLGDAAALGGVLGPWGFAPLGKAPWIAPR